MKVCSLPDECPAPETDYNNYNHDVEQIKEDEHLEQLKQQMILMGYKGPLTGEVVRFGHADGYAQYMYADSARPCLIHLPYGDAWDSPLAHYMPKKDVIKQIQNQKNIARIFA